MDFEQVFICWVTSKLTVKILFIDPLHATDLFIYTLKA